MGVKYLRCPSLRADPFQTFSETWLDPNSAILPMRSPRTTGETEIPFAQFCTEGIQKQKLARYRQDLIYG